MSQRQYVRDLCTMCTVALAMIAAAAIFGALAGVAVLAVALLIAGWVAVTRKLDATDEWCARIDRELDQEKAAREALRTQHTVTAEPQAPVVDINTRKPIT